MTHAAGSEGSAIFNFTGTDPETYGKASILWGMYVRENSERVTTTNSAVVLLSQVTATPLKLLLIQPSYTAWDV